MDHNTCTFVLLPGTVIPYCYEYSWCYRCFTYSSACRKSTGSSYSTLELRTKIISFFKLTLSASVPRAGHTLNRLSMSPTTLKQQTLTSYRSHNYDKHTSAFLTCSHTTTHIIDTPLRSLSHYHNLRLYHRLSNHSQ